MLATKLQTLDTVLTADSVEWCPCPGFEQLLACGTYQLDEGRKRHGALTCYQLQHSPRVELKPLPQPDLTDGILDMKWCASKEGPLLALASSQGRVVFLQAKEEPNLSFVCKLCEAVQCTEVTSGSDKQGLCLSLDWYKGQSSPPVLAVSDSLGRVSMVELTGTGPRLLYGWKAHDFEAWITIFGGQSHVVFSGGDDCRLHAWDTRMGLVKPSFTSKRHEMGVCSLQIHPTKEHILASGSYDENLLLWDTRSMASPLKEARLGGGIWRVKWNSHTPDFLAAACMHNGFSVVNSNLSSGDTMEIVACYKEHDSLAYGIDWQRSSLTRVNSIEHAGQGDDSHDRDSSSHDCSHDHLDESHDQDDDAMKRAHCAEQVLASCSFYDHSLHLWKIT